MKMNYEEKIQKIDDNLFELSCIYEQDKDGNVQKSNNVYKCTIAEMKQGLQALEATRNNILKQYNEHKGKLDDLLSHVKKNRYVKSPTAEMIKIKKLLDNMNCIEKMQNLQRQVDELMPHLEEYNKRIEVRQEVLKQHGN
jgi:hypothetical protein